MEESQRETLTTLLVSVINYRMEEADPMDFVELGAPSGDYIPIAEDVAAEIVQKSSWSLDALEELVYKHMALNFTAEIVGPKSRYRVVAVGIQQVLEM